MHDGDIVVIGGGYAGVRLARKLDATARVTLVDRKEVFFHRIASLRAGVRPDWTRTPFIPYDRLLHNGRVAVGKVVRVDTAERQVVLAGGERLPYDVAVIATGADYPRQPHHDPDQGQDAHDAVHAAPTRLHRGLIPLPARVRPVVTGSRPVSPARRSGGGGRSGPGRPGSTGH